MKAKLKNTLLRNMDTIARESHTIYEYSFKKHNLQRGQFIFLTRICENPDISLKDLSYELKMDKTTVTKAIQKLIVAGYVNKYIDNEDRRLNHLRPTAKALKTYNEIIAEKNRIIAICLKGITAKNLDLLDNFINIILDNLNQEWNKLIIDTN